MIRPLLPAALVLAIAPVSPCSGQAAPSHPGRDLAAACANCHGTNGASQAGIPGLARRDRSELVRLMQDFKSGKRPATVMHQLARGYSDEQIEAIAAYLATQSR